MKNNSNVKQKIKSIVGVWFVIVKYFFNIFLFLTVTDTLLNPGILRVLYGYSSCLALSELRCQDEES